MAKTITSLSKIESELLSALSAEGKNIFTTDDASAVLKKGKTEIRNILARLSGKSWIDRLERGKYLIVPLEAGPERMWSEDAFIMASHLINPYAISYWSALSFWNLTEQLPRTVFVSSTSRKSTNQKEVIGIPYRFVTLSPEKFFGIKKVWISSTKVNITDPEKTIIDCLDHPEYCGGITEGAKGLATGIESGEVDLKKVTDYALRINNKTVFKRLGYLCEIFGIETKKSLIWSENISGGYSILDPTAPDRGSYIRRWKLKLNVDVNNLTEWREH